MFLIILNLRRILKKKTVVKPTGFPPNAQAGRLQRTTGLLLAHLGYKTARSVRRVLFSFFALHFAFHGST